MGIIDYHSPLNVLISVKGHPFERDAFAAVFESFEGIRHTFVEQPASQSFMNADAAEPWDVLVFYDMPGIDFSTQPPGLVPPSDALKQGLMDLLASGKGMVFLHHAIAGWPLWPEYGEIIGGRFFYLPSECRGRPVLDSGYRHDVSHEISVADTTHPITAASMTHFHSPMSSIFTRCLRMTSSRCSLAATLSIEITFFQPIMR